MINASPEPVLLRCKFVHLSGQDKAGPKHPRLLISTLGKICTTEPTRESEIVPYQRTRPCLTADGLALHNQGPQALRSGVDGGSEAGRPCPNDQQVELALVLSQGSRDTPSLKDLIVSGIHQASAAYCRHPDDDLTFRLARLNQYPLAELRGPGPKGVRDTVPSEQVADCVRPSGMLCSNHHNFTHIRWLAARPLSHEFSNRSMEELVPGDPWLEDVIADVADSHALQNPLCGFRMRPGAPRHQKRAARFGVESPRCCEDFRPPVVGKRVVDQDDRDSLLPTMRCLQSPKRVFT